MSRWWMWWRSAERRWARDCPEDDAELQSYLDGELDAPASRRIRAHVARCHRCAGELAAYQRVTNALASRRAREGLDEAALGRLRDLAGSLADPERSRSEDRSRTGDRAGDRAGLPQERNGLPPERADLPQERAEREPSPLPGLEDAPLPPGEPDASESAVPKAGG
ncbi:zf-HC2 domain-containing protein [Streptomyces sparsogenes]|uniref:anti-sigma factor family protein n=1 Tax=Streptomyces sparsogenes TaxID=67365 RepID=UPI0033E49479